MFYSRKQKKTPKKVYPIGTKINATEKYSQNYFKANTTKKCFWERGWYCKTWQLRKSNHHETLEKLLVCIANLDRLSVCSPIPPPAKGNHSCKWWQRPRVAASPGSCVARAAVMGWGSFQVPPSHSTFSWRFFPQRVAIWSLFMGSSSYPRSRAELSGTELSHS